MAKVPFTKLKCKINTNEIPVQIGEETIVVKQYLPIQEKLELIGKVVMAAHEQDENYSNPVKADAFTALEMIFAYTNITFTEKQLEDTPKLYDQLCSSGVMGMIFKAIPKEEIETICTGVEQSIKSIYKYQNSALGILDTIKTDYSNLKFDAEKIKADIGDPSNLELLKKVLTNLG